MLRQENKNELKGMKIKKEEIKVSLFLDDCAHRKSRTIFRLIVTINNRFNKVTRNKINVRKSIVPLCSYSIQLKNRNFYMILLTIYQKNQIPRS